MESDQEERMVTLCVDGSGLRTVWQCVATLPSHVSAVPVPTKNVTKTSSSTVPLMAVKVGLTSSYTFSSSYLSLLSGQ
jgi:hypothetical protein